MVIYAFEKLRIIFGVIIFHFKETISNINTKSSSPHHLPPAYEVFFHFLFLFFLSFQGPGVCFQSFISPERDHTEPSLSPFLFLQMVLELADILFSIFKLWLVKHPFVRWGSTAQALVAVRGGWMWCGFRSARLQGFEAVCPPGASEQVGRAALRVRLHLVTVAAWGQCTWLGVLLALGCPGASPAAKAMAQARCWGAHAPSPPCS